MLCPRPQAELLGLSFHHTLDREHMGATKVRMQAANLWELRHGVTIVLAGHQHQHQQQQVQLVQMPLAPPAAAPGQPGAPPSGTSMSAGGAGAGAGAAAPEAGLGSRGPAAAGAGKSSRALSVTEGGGAGAAGGSGIVRREPIVGLWRPDDSSSWEEEPLLLMRVVHGGVDAQWVTYEHIEVRPGSGGRRRAGDWAVGHWAGGRLKRKGQGIWAMRSDVRAGGSGGQQLETRVCGVWEAMPCGQGKEAPHKRPTRFLLLLCTVRPRHMPSRCTACNYNFGPNLVTVLRPRAPAAQVTMHPLQVRLTYSLATQLAVSHSGG